MLKRKFHSSCLGFAKYRWWENETNLELFEKYGLHRAQIIKAKTLLGTEFSYIRQNLEFLVEAKVPISLDHLVGTRKIATTDITTLHNEKLIPDLNVTERFLENLPDFEYNHDIPMPSYSGIAQVYRHKIQYYRRLFSKRDDSAWPEDIHLETNWTLLNEQRRVLRQFFAYYFSTNVFTIDRLMYNYMAEPKIRGCRSFITALSILETQLDFPRNWILRNFFLMRIPVERLLSLIHNVKKIGQVDFKSAVLMTPKILVKKTAEVLDMEKAFQEYGIDSPSPFRVHLMTLTSSTLRSRLKKLSEGEMKAFLTHPRICDVLFYFNKACRRLKEIEARGMKCISLHILTGNQKAFDRYLSEGVDRTHCCQDIIYYLSQALGGNRTDVYKLLKRHPLRFFVPLAECMATTEALLERGISKEVILESIPIVLYPRENVIKALDLIEKDEDLKNLGFCGGFVQSESTFRMGSKFLDRRVILCLYFLELPFHFTGDGAMRASHKVKKKKDDKKKLLEQATAAASQPADRRPELPKTKAEMAFLKQQEKMREERINQKAEKTHKQRVEEFNRHLDSLTEHFDIPKVSWTK